MTKTTCWGKKTAPTLPDSHRFSKTHSTRTGWLYLTGAGCLLGSSNCEVGFCSKTPRAPVDRPAAKALASYSIDIISNIIKSSSSSSSPAASAALINQSINLSMLIINHRQCSAVTNARMKLQKPVTSKRIRQAAATACNGLNTADSRVGVTKFWPR